MSTEELPSSFDAEKSLLGAYLRDPREVGAMCAERGFTAERFHIPAHAVVFEVLAEMWAAGVRISHLGLLQKLRDKKVLDDCGGAAALRELYEFMPTAANAPHYAEIVQEKFILRTIIAECRLLTNLARTAQEDVPAVVTRFVEAAGQVSTPMRTEAVKTMRDLVRDKLARLSSETPSILAVSTGLTKLDKESPVQMGSMPLICGLPKSGKSILATTIALNVAKDKKPVLYFSLEDPAAATVDRMAANLSRVPIATQKRGLMNSVQEDDMLRVMDEMKELPITIRADVFDLGAILAVIEQQKTQCPDLALVVVDYAQLVKAQVRKNDNREMEVAKVSRALRLLSIRLNVCIIVLSQLNEDGASRESRALEQDCTAKWVVSQTDQPNVRTLEIPFQRNGSSKVFFKLTFLGYIARFENYTGADEEVEAPETGRKKKK